MQRRGFLKLVPGVAVGIVAATKNISTVESQTTLQDISAKQRDAQYIALYRSGFAIDAKTIAEALDIPNYGYPTDCKTVYERWIHEQKKLPV